MVQADIRVLPGISGHADREGLMRWLKAYEPGLKKVFVNHGEDSVCQTFADRIRDELGYDTLVPFSGTVYDLKENRCLLETRGIPVTEPSSVGERPVARGGTTRPDKRFPQRGTEGG